MCILCFEALQCFDCDRVATNFTVGINGKGVKGTSSKCRIIYGRFEDKMRFEGVVVEDIDFAVGSPFSVMRALNFFHEKST